jgi:sugar lactone lactonase YvrE
MRTISLLATALAPLVACTGDDAQPHQPSDAPTGPAVLALPGDAFYPESIQVAGDGTLYVSSLATGQIVAFDRDATEPRVVIEAGEYGITGATGVNIRGSELFVCSVDTTFQRPTELRSFSLAGEPHLTIALRPTEFCNDLEFDIGGNAYVADSFSGSVQRLLATAQNFTTYAIDPRLAPATMGAFGLDGIVLTLDGLIVNKFDTGQLFRITSTGALPTDKTITEITVTPPLVNPDGMRLIDDGTLVVVEGGAGRLSRLVITGDTAISTPIATDLDGPTGVAISGGTAYVTEGQLGRLFAGEAPKLPFAVRRIEL